MVIGCLWRRFSPCFPFFWIISVLCICIHPESIFSYASVQRCRQNNSDTKFIDNGYEDLLVLVGEEVEEDYNLIEDLRKLLNNMSDTMFQVTNRRAYIRQVAVLLPRSWGNPPKELEDIMQVKTDSVHSGESGDFRLRNRSPRSNEDSGSWKLGDEEARIDVPYVIKPTPCGYSGRYLRLTPEFVRFGSSPKVKEEIGTPGKIMLRQWAKLRWGVYDEIPVDGAGSNFYIHTDLKIHPVACSMELKGKITRSDDNTRSCSRIEALNDERCEFTPDYSLSNSENPKKLSSSTKSNKGGYASLMYRPDLEHVDQFCDSISGSGESIPVERQHNAEAPTVHNLHCQGRSIWEIMREHPDFANGNNPPRPENFTNPQVEFSLLQNPDRRIVLVLDVSTSMNRFNRLKLMRQAASQFIETVPKNSWIGIVTFAVQATVMSELVEITSNDVRRLLKERLPTNLVAGTSIGRGILKGLDVLKDSGPKHMRNSGGSMLVLSDGKEHNIPKINDTLRQVLEFGVKVTTIAFGNDVSDDLEILSELTGGSSYFASSGEFSDNSELRNAFLGIIESREDDVVVVSSQSVRIRQKSTIEHEFIIDETIGSETRITVLYTDAVPPIVGICNPNGEIIWENDDIGYSNITADFSWDREFSTKTIQYFGTMEFGRWKLLLRNQKIHRGITADITVFSRPGDAQESLIVSPALLCRQINYTGSESVVIYAHLSLGEFAVLDARVEAVVTRPLSGSGSYDTATVILKDDGRGADVIADDGIYSGYFTSFTLQGRYNVKVNASDSGAARIDLDYILGLGRRRENLVTLDTKDALMNAARKEDNQSKSRQRRAIRSGLLKPFSRWSSQQKDFVVEQAVATVCPEGYHHFQDSCYKFVRIPMLPAEQASALCETEGGYLARVDSTQEFMHILDNVRGRETWFGGIDESLNQEDLFPPDRIRRQSEDDDLTALAEAFKANYIDRDLRKLIESFAPDWEGMSRREMNRIMQILGITSQADIERLKESKLLTQQHFDDLLTTPSSFRRKRQADTAPVGSGDISFSTTESGTARATSIENVTLALAKPAPELKHFESSGEQKPGCSWLNNRRVFETTGEVCNKNTAFYCERPKIDLVPPSRIIDLKIRKTKDPQILKFTWTATGDDNTNGRATRYELRNLRTTKARQLLINFDIGEKVKREAIIQGSTDNPRISGLKEEILVNVTEISSCPAHAAVDVILVLPERLLSPNQVTRTQREGTYQMLQTLLTVFKISLYEVQVTLVAVKNQTGRIIFRDSNSFEQARTVLIGGVDFQNTPEEDLAENDLAKILDELAVGGRVDIPKLVLSLITDEDIDTAVVLKDSTTEINHVLVGVGITDKDYFRSIVSDPVCLNAIFADDWNGLNDTVGVIANQICRARHDEYQAWGIVAVDEEGQRSEPSNVVSSIIENRPEPVICPPEPTKAVMPRVAGVDSVTIGLAVGLPVGLLLGVVGFIMLFGQVKKHRRKKRLEKERKAKQAAGADAKNPEAKDARGGSNPKLKNNKTAPITQPPV